ncbi:MAG: hypothetical protein IT365_04335 [Candidatus Hydrogenedentes bacterium]|nr:hypothetical protein [Candidatus Hydrogenedentota bacterium]
MLSPKSAAFPGFWPRIGKFLHVLVSLSVPIQCLILSDNMLAPLLYVPLSLAAGAWFLPLLSLAGLLSFACALDVPIRPMDTFMIGQAATVLALLMSGRLTASPTLDDVRWRLLHRYGRPLRVFLFVAATILLSHAALFQDADVLFDVVWSGTLFGFLWAVPWPPPVARVNWRDQGINLAVLAASLLVSAAGLEWATRLLLTDPLKPSDVYAPDPEFIFTLQPGGEGEVTLLDNDGTPLRREVRISSQGLRDREYGPKRDGEFRIIVLGDSYTMGHGLYPEETYAMCLESLLNASEPPMDCTVINCGIGGYAPWQEKGFLEKRGFPLDPDLVILQLFPSNDVAGSYSRIGGQLPAFDPCWESRLRLMRSQSQWTMRVERWLQGHSNVYRALENIAGSRGFIIDLADALRFRPATTKAKATSPSRRNPNQEVCLVNWYPQLREAWELFARDVRAIRDTCAGHGVGLIAFVHGDPISLDPEGWRELNRKHPETPYEMNKDIRITRELLADLGIPQVDVIERLSKYPRPQDLYFNHDGHFTPAGAGLVAESLQEFLMTEYGLTRHLASGSTQLESREMDSESQFATHGHPGSASGKQLDTLLTPAENPLE